MNWHKAKPHWKIHNTPDPITGGSAVDHKTKTIHYCGECEPELVPEGYSKVHEFAHARLNDRGLDDYTALNFHVSHEYFAMAHTLHWLKREHPDRLANEMDDIRICANNLMGGIVTSGRGEEVNANKSLETL